MVVRPTILDDFKTLVKQQGMSESTIIIKNNKGKAQRSQLDHQHMGTECSVQWKTYNVPSPINLNILYIFVHKLKFE